MATALNFLIDQEFVSPDDKDEVPTTWIYRTLSGIEVETCYNNDGTLNRGRIVELGLTGWRDFPDYEGNQMAFSQAKIGHIPATILVDISFEIINKSMMTEKERKNSQSQS